MGAYVYAIKSKKPVIGHNLTGDKVSINYAPYIEKYWSDSWENRDSFSMKPLNGIVTRSERYHENGELAEFVMFDDPKENPRYDGEEGTFDIYNRDGHVTWFDEPDYNREGAIAVAKLLPHGNKKKLLFTARYGTWKNNLIKINNIFGTFDNPRFECNEWDWKIEKWNRTYVDLNKEDIDFFLFEKPEKVNAY